MSLSIGIIGLPNVGKSTLFNALLKRQAALVANYPFATIEPNVGVVDVPDHRLERLAEIVRADYGERKGDREIPEKIIPATIKFYDIAGLVKGASQGEGLGNEFLGHIREVDALVHLVRTFSDPNIIQTGVDDPEENIDVINTELILSDLQSISKRSERLEKEVKTDKSEDLAHELEACRKIFVVLNDGKLAKSADLSDKEELVSKNLNLLTLKPMIVVYNSDEDILYSKDQQNQSADQSNILKISAKIESEIYSIDDIVERAEFMKEMGMTTSGLDMVVRKAYEILDLETYFTAGPKEVHAWTYTRGTTAPKAAGKIHTDFERGFISAVIVNYEQLNQAGSMKAAQLQGLVRLEGKEYIFKDGDIAEFNFSV
ncbi:redox-regulated ATPase YchF [candidate division WWE3 bacterium RIFOXYD1_FULL_39_9]|uniref:Ribosome-binding ATPase YchF n=2 Tax=Katanobacteria TaxID=422282 RepID=A0A1F4X7D9_UNCKA|nr:MAG: redox-regulated ATPase YchF [candidate division WWE3 bacterium RIFOXYD1_FULL_39_9]